MELESSEKAKEISENWNAHLFGGSSCRLTKKYQESSVILKDFPLPRQLSYLGLEEGDLDDYFKSRYSGCSVERFIRKDQTPMKIVKLTFPEKQHFDKIIEDGGIFVEHLWVNAEVSRPPKPRVIQCFNCCQMGHVASHCPKATSTCSHCSLTDHSFTTCQVPRQLWKCVNCKGNHDAMDRSCRIWKEKTKQIEERHSNRQRNG